MTRPQFWLDVRQGLLMIVAAIERDKGLALTSELRKELKAVRRKLAAMEEEDAT